MRRASSLTAPLLALALAGLSGRTPGQTPEAARPPSPASASAEVKPYDPSRPDFDLSRHLRFDGELRLRYEYTDPLSYSAAGLAARDDFVLQRTRLGALAALHEKIDVRVLIEDSRLWGEESPDPPAGAGADNPAGAVVNPIDNLDLHEGYVDLKHLFEAALGKGALSLRLGRQELNYGDQRLVSSLDWHNVERAWDAGRLRFAPAAAPGGFKADLFASILRDRTSAAATDDTQEFHGIYATFSDLRPCEAWRFGAGEASRPVLGRHEADFYGLYRRLTDGDRTPGGPFSGEDGSIGTVSELTLGTRLAGEAWRTPRGAGLDYSGELAGQVGRFSGDDISAYGYAVAGGYTFAGEALGETKVRAGLEYDYGSGDSDPADGKHERFDPLFPFGHYYQGIGDVFSWKNGQDLAFKLALMPPKATRIAQVEAQYHLFWLSERRDGWFNAGLVQMQRDATGGSGNHVGSELDLQLRYLLIPPFATLLFGYAHFFPGQFAKKTAGDVDRDFAFAQLSVAF